MKIFIAGATGAVGLPLVRVLLALGHEVTGMTRQGAGDDQLRAVGAKVARADAFDGDSVFSAMKAADPDVVIDQLTRLPANPADVIKAMPSDTRLHEVGGGNLLAAAEELGIGRYIMQSRAFYLDAAEGELADESSRLSVHAPGEVGRSASVLANYEERVLLSADVSGVVLRYGFFYGPGTWYSPTGAVADQAREGQCSIVGAGNAVWSFVHIDDAIAATVGALCAEGAVYNVVDDNPLPVSEWMPAFCRWVDAPGPIWVDEHEARTTSGAEAVYYHTGLRGASNRRARGGLGFKPRPLLWKDA